jgi:hypothetical protein
MLALKHMRIWCPCLKDNLAVMALYEDARDGLGLEDRNAEGTEVY